MATALHSAEQPTTATGRPDEIDRVDLAGAERALSVAEEICEQVERAYRAARDQANGDPTALNLIEAERAAAHSAVDAARSNLTYVLTHGRPITAPVIAVSGASRFAAYARNRAMVNEANEQIVISEAARERIAIRSQVIHVDDPEQMLRFARTFVDERAPEAVQHRMAVEIAEAMVNDPETVAAIETLNRATPEAREALHTRIEHDAALLGELVARSVHGSQAYETYNLMLHGRFMGSDGASEIIRGLHDGSLQLSDPEVQTALVLITGRAVAQAEEIIEQTIVEAQRSDDVLDGSIAETVNSNDLVNDGAEVLDRFSQIMSNESRRAEIVGYIERLETDRNTHWDQFNAEQQADIAAYILGHETSATFLLIESSTSALITRELSVEQQQEWDVVADASLGKAERVAALQSMAKSSLNKTSFTPEEEAAILAGAERAVERFDLGQGRLAETRSQMISRNAAVGAGMLLRGDVLGFGEAVVRNLGDQEHEDKITELLAAGINVRPELHQLLDRNSDGHLDFFTEVKPVLQYVDISYDQMAALNEGDNREISEVELLRALGLYESFQHVDMAQVNELYGERLGRHDMSINDVRRFLNSRVVNGEHVTIGSLVGEDGKFSQDELLAAIEDTIAALADVSEAETPATPEQEAPAATPAVIAETTVTSPVRS